MTETSIAEVAAREMRTQSGHVQVSLNHATAGYSLTVSRETHAMRWGFFPTVRHEVIWRHTTADQHEAERWFEEAVDLFV